MKKLFKFFLPIVLLLSSCSGGSLKKETTVILDVTTNVTPTFTANFGEGSYEGNVYTHKISYFKDLYIYLSYEGLSTETVYIPTSEMTSSTIRKSVTFGNPLKVKVTVKADYIKDLTPATIETENTLLANEVDEDATNIATLTFSGRDKDIDFTYKLDGYKDTHVHIDKARFISGICNATATFLKTNEIAVIVDNGQVEVVEYPSMVTVKKLSAYNGNSVSYILDNTKDYYVRYRDSDNDINVVKMVDKENGITINTNVYYPSGRFAGNLYISSSVNPTQQDYSYEYLLLEKTSNRLSCTTNIYDSLYNYSVLIEHSSDSSKTYFIEDLHNYRVEVVKPVEEYMSTQYYLVIDNLSAIPQVGFSYNIYNYIKPSETLYSNNAFYDVGGEIYNTLYEFINNTFVINRYQYKHAPISIDIYDQNGTKIYDYDSTFWDPSVSYFIIINEKKVLLRFDMIIDYLVYDEVNDVYTYPDVTINTSKNFIKLYDFSRGQIQISSVYNKTASSYADVVDDWYFDALVDNEYMVTSINGDAYSFTVTQLDIDSGFAYTNPKGSYRLQFLEQLDYVYTSNSYTYRVEDVNYLRSSDWNININITYFLNSEHTDSLLFTFSMRNGMTSSTLIDLIPYYGLGLKKVDGVGYTGDRNRYIYNRASLSSDIMFYLVAVDGGGMVSLNTSDFEYNEGLKSYGISSEKYKAIHFTNGTYSDFTFDKPVYTDGMRSDIVYVSNDATMTYQGHEYVLADQSRTYMDVAINGDEAIFSDWSMQ